MKFLALLAIGLPLLFISCEDDDAPSDGLVPTTIDFRATYNNNDLNIQSTAYDYPTGEQLKVTLFQYYISDLELLPADGGDAVRLSDIELIRYQAATDGPVSSRTYDVPPGNYVGLRFGLGVKPSLNAMDPNNFAANYVLNENEFWGAAARYVFAKIEANADLEANGLFDTGLTYHLGSDALYSLITFTQNFTIGEGQGPRLSIVADVLDALSSGSETFDITNPEQQRVHGGNQAIGLAIWERLEGQFALEVQ